MPSCLEVQLLPRGLVNLSGPVGIQRSGDRSARDLHGQSSSLGVFQERLGEA